MMVDFQSKPGKGVSASVGEDRYHIGNRSFIRENDCGFSEPFLAKDAQWDKEARSLVYVSKNHKVVAVFAITDTIKPSTRAAIEGLRQMGIEIHMISGDTNSITAYVAEETGIHNYQGEITPAGKSEYIRKLKQSGKHVAMVGDGINDSPALALADIGIAMGTGTDVAMESAQITLIRGDLEKILTCIRLSRKTVKTIHQNLFWAFFYNIISIPIAAGILYPFTGFLLNPMIAGAGMAFSSVMVVSNSLRLKRNRI